MLKTIVQQKRYQLMKNCPELPKILKGSLSESDAFNGITYAHPVNYNHLQSISTLNENSVQDVL